MLARYNAILPTVLIVATAWLVFATPTSAAPAQARCAQWSIPPTLNIHHSNGWNLTLTGQGNELHGSAVAYFQPSGKAMIGANVQKQSGTFDGKTRGREIQLAVYWSATSIGAYTGKINDRGRIEGRSHDRMHPEQTATWFADELATCAQQGSAKAR